MKFNLEQKVIIVFKKDKELPLSPEQTITISLKQLLENTTDDFHGWLEESIPCTSSSCNNESQNFCDCGGNFEDYEIVEIIIPEN